MDEPIESVSSSKPADETVENAPADAPTLTNGTAAETDTTTNGGDGEEAHTEGVDVSDEKESSNTVEHQTTNNDDSLDGIPDIEDESSNNTPSKMESLTESLTTIDDSDNSKKKASNGPCTDDPDSPTLAAVPGDAVVADDDDANTNSKDSRDEDVAEEELPEGVNGYVEGAEDDDNDEVAEVRSESDEEGAVDPEETNGTVRPAQHSGDIQEDVSQEACDSLPSSLNPLEADHINDDDIDDDDDDDAMVVDESATNGAESDEEEGNDAGSGEDCNDAGSADEGNDAHVHSISDSEDEEAHPNDDEVDEMEVDGEENEDNDDNSDENGVDDDKPVIIASDSEDPAAEEPVVAKNGVDKPSEMSNKPAVEDEEEDCVVIEDDTTEDLSPRRSVRSRKSVLKVRDMSAFDEDIEEITDDPLAQPAAKKQKTESPSKLGITIQDARSLAPGSSSNSSVKKDSSLALTDPNSILSRSNAASVLALQNQNISVRPVSAAHQSPTVFPSNIRASITPVNSNKTPQNHNNNNHSTSPPNQTRPPSNTTTTSTTASLLPALTDDMFVLEAPSFIVPYIYEKPPADNLREIVETIRKDLADQKKQEDVDVAEKEAKELEAMSAEQRKLAELARAADANKKKASSKKKPAKNADDSWGESDTSTDDETSDTELRTKVLIKEADNDMDAIKTQIQADGTVLTTTGAKRDNYFESPLGKFFMDIAINLVQEHVQTDLLRQQKKRLRREGESAAPSVEMAIKSLTKNLEHSKSKNQMFKFQNKRCEFCNFKSESALAMAHHYEAPHLNGQMYKCNFCPFEARPPYDILFHMEAIHNVKARLEKAQTYHQCPNCPFEDNGKSKLARHALVCAKKFRPEINLNPPLDWEPPAKIPRIKPRHGLVGTATAYQAMAAQAQRSANNAAMLLQRQNAALVNAAAAAAQAQIRGRGRPQTIAKTSPAGSVLRNNIQTQQQQQQQQQQLLMNRSLAGMSMQNAGFQLNAAGQFVQTTGSKSSKSAQQPSISITPLPRQATATAGLSAAAMAQMQAAAAAVKPPSAAAANMKPGQHPGTGSKTSFVICEICDGYIKDLDQLRNHMQWMHKVKIHPKMIYNRPPLNCQKCQFRFFTDQGLERHLLGSHGLVTSSMQDAANKGKDSGRCPVCGRMYQWKLLNHVSRDHNMTLKPAHLSYKCTVCTATFGMYKQFENHVYSAHSNVAKKAMDVKSKGASSKSAAATTAAGGSSSGHNAGDSLLKPFKINDEISIIPHPAHLKNRGPGTGGGSRPADMHNDTQIIEIL